MLPYLLDMRMLSEALTGRNLVGLTLEELERLAENCGQPRYRGRQLYHGIYGERHLSFDSFTNLNRGFSNFLSLHYRLQYPTIRQKIVSSDKSTRYLLGLEDGETIEAVYMPEETRSTICISSQVGCAVNCCFCFTALLGVKRHLKAGEIVGEILAITQDQNQRRNARLNVVFMGMGEPLLNFEEVMRAVRVLADPKGVGIPVRRITLSTAGIVPGIQALGREPIRPKLAVSLNASTEEQRTALMPLNRKYSLQALLEACCAYPLRPREWLTFEYVMLDGINDSDADAIRVADLLHKLRAKVNLIPYNPGPDLPYSPSPLPRILAFQQSILERGIPTFIRISRGRDIMAACGQLSLQGDSGMGPGDRGRAQIYHEPV